MLMETTTNSFALFLQFAALKNSTASVYGGKGIKNEQRIHEDRILAAIMP